MIQIRIQIYCWLKFWQTRKKKLCCFPIVLWLALGPFWVLGFCNSYRYVTRTNLHVFRNSSWNLVFSRTVQILIIYLIYIHASKEHKPSYLLLCSNIQFIFVGVILFSGKENNLKILPMLTLCRELVWLCTNHKL